jgi:hypothetical protein
VFTLCLIRQKIWLDYQCVLPFISERIERHHVLRNRLGIGYYDPRKFIFCKSYCQNPGWRKTCLHCLFVIVLSGFPLQIARVRDLERQSLLMYSPGTYGVVYKARELNYPIDRQLRSWFHCPCQTQFARDLGVDQKQYVRFISRIALLSTSDPIKSNQSYFPVLTRIQISSVCQCPLATMSYLPTGTPLVP